MSARVKMIASAVIWGSMGLVVRWTHLNASLIALARGALGAAFLLMVLRFTGRRVSWRAVRQNLGLLVLSGALLGANWIFLFEAYRRTTIPLATLSYYLAPVLIMAASPLVLKERLSARKVSCLAAALIGMALVSGACGGGQAVNLSGILLGLCAAVCYASLTLINKFLKGVSPMEATVVQLGVSSLALAPYVLATGALNWAGAGTTDALLLITLGVVHTGLAFWGFFSSVRDLKAQTVAMLSYIDPATALILSAVILGERLDAPQLLGACLILGAAFLGEMAGRPASRAQSGLRL